MKHALRTGMSESVFGDHFVLWWHSTFLLHFLFVHTIERAWLERKDAILDYLSIRMVFPFHSLSIPIKFLIQKSYRNQVCRTAPTLTYILYTLLHGNPSPSWMPYRYQSSFPYKSRLENKYVVQHPHSRIGYTNFCVGTHRYFGLYRYQTSSSYKTRIAAKLVVQLPRSRIVYTNFCIKTRRHIGFPIHTYRYSSRATLYQKPKESKFVQSPCAKASGKVKKWKNYTKMK